MAKKTMVQLLEEINLKDEQKEFLNQFSQIRTANRFEQFALDKIGQPELIKDWVYNGFIDTYEFPGDHCTRGHALRFVHFAKNIVTNEEVKFGIKCVSEFFHLTELQLKLIRKGFYETNRYISDCLSNLDEFGTFQKYDEVHHAIKKFELAKSEMFEATDYIQDEGKQFKRLIEIGLFENFIKYELPFPKKVMKEIEFYYHKALRKMTNLDAKQHFFALNPDMEKTMEIVDELLLKDGVPSHLKTQTQDIRNHFDMYSDLSYNQKRFLQKIASYNYELAKQVITQLNKKRLNFGKFDKELFENLIFKFNKYPLTDKQIEVLNRINSRY